MKALQSMSKTILITGASSGFGRDTAETLFRADHTVYASMRGTQGKNREAAEALRKLGIMTVELDVSDDASVEAGVKKVLVEAGKIDVLVNNAGITGPTASVDRVTRADWDHTLAVNLTGAFLCAKAVLPHMAERGSGKIINISSVAGHIGYALRAPYAVSKWGMLGLTRTLAAEWGAKNIQVNAISPGSVSGERIERVIRERAASSGQAEREVRREYTSKAALDRFVPPEHVAAMAVFLASELGDSITGEFLQVAGGFNLG